MATFHNKEKSRTIVEHMNIVPFIQSNMSISDIQLASKMVQGSENTKSIFYKNTYEIMPIPNLVFGKSQPALFFYTELYNLQSDKLKSPTLKLNEIIYNSRGKILKQKSKNISRSTSSRVEVGAFVLSSYPTDTYTLALALIDSMGNQATTTSKKFFVYNPDIVVVDTFETSMTSSISSLFGAMSEEELDDLFQKSKYISTPQEIEKYEKLNNLEGKRSFMNEFWKNKDTNPNTPENEFFREYMQRIEVANQKYSAMGKIGWKTDRGRTGERVRCEDALAALARAGRAGRALRDYAPRQAGRPVDSARGGRRHIDRAVARSRRSNPGASCATGRHAIVAPRAGRARSRSRALRPSLLGS
jgi:GWxTD domain-containing protein